MEFRHSGCAGARGGGAQHSYRDKSSRPILSMKSSYEGKKTPGRLFT